jgi:hypothetical protein
MAKNHYLFQNKFHPHEKKAAPKSGWRLLLLNRPKMNNKAHHSIQRSGGAVSSVWVEKYGRV